MRQSLRTVGLCHSYSLSARLIRQCPRERMNRAPLTPRRHSATQSPTRQGDAAGPVLVCANSFACMHEYKQQNQNTSYYLGNRRRREDGTYRIHAATSQRPPVCYVSGKRGPQLRPITRHAGWGWRCYVVGERGPVHSYGPSPDTQQGDGDARPLATSPTA